MLETYNADLISQWPLVHQGKVRDSFAIDENTLLIVASDRLSAFDVVLPNPIPGKGEILTRISNFWFERTERLVANHCTDISLADLIDDPALLDVLQNRAVVVQRLKPLPMEAIVRGYIIGSGWKDYQESGEICGISLPPDLQQADKLPSVIFTPSSKAPCGDHDVNVSYADIVELIGGELASEVKTASIAIYEAAIEYARKRGIIIADTKFEFGLDKEGRLRLMDEVLTPDSSRFWPAETYQTGTSPPSYDKQYVRDYLETLDWDKKAPGPELPADVIEATADRYSEALSRLTGPETTPDRSED